MLGKSATGCGCGGISDLGLSAPPLYGTPFNAGPITGSLPGNLGGLNGAQDTDAASMGVGVLVAIGLIAWAATGFKGL